MASLGDLPDEAKLASIMVQSALYGIYTVLFIRTMAVLFRRNIMKTGMHRVMTATAVVMWITATGHLSVGGLRVVRIFAQERFPGNGPSSLSRFSGITNLINVGLNLLQILLGDAFLLYRMAIVWGRNWRFYAFPLVLLTASMATGVGVIYQLGGGPDGGFVVPARWIVSFIAMTLSTNIFCTSLIAVKVWKINSFSSKLVGHSLTPVILVVIESGAIYSCTLITLLICYLNHNWGQFLIMDWIAPIVGCVFSMVIVRLGLGLCRPDGTTFHQDPGQLDMSWESPQRRSSDAFKLTAEDVSAIRDDPKSERAVNSYQGQSVFPAAVDSSIAESHLAWRT